MPPKLEYATERRCACVAAPADRWNTVFAGTDVDRRNSSLHLHLKQWGLADWADLKQWWLVIRHTDTAGKLHILVALTGCVG